MEAAWPGADGGWLSDVAANTFEVPAGSSSITASIARGVEFWVTRDADNASTLSAFGAPFVLNEPINLATLPSNPQQISFPPGVYIMTAVLSSQNLWSIYPGAPVAKDAQSGGMVIDYVAGQGLVAQTKNSL